MRKSLVLVALPFILSSCSLSTTSGSEERFASITDGPSFAAYMIPRDIGEIVAASTIRQITNDLPVNETFGRIQSQRIKEAKQTQDLYRSWTGNIYPVNITSPTPFVNLDGLSAGDAIKQYAETAIAYNEETIAAAKHAQKTASGAALSDLVEQVLSSREKELEELRPLAKE